MTEENNMWETFDITNFSQDDQSKFNALIDERKEIITKLVKLDVETITRLNKIDVELQDIAQKYGKIN